MSLKSQLLIYINSLLLIATLIGLMTIMMVTQKNVREEVLSTMSLAEFAIEQGVKKNPDFYLFQRENNELGISELSGIRHLKIQFYDENDVLLEETLNTLDEYSIDTFDQVLDYDDQKLFEFFFKNESLGNEIHEDFIDRYLKKFHKQGNF